MSCWLLALLCTLLTAPSTAAQSGEMPRYLRQLEQAYHAGDWTLQCRSDRSCQIIGAVNRPLGDGATRVVVLIARAADQGAVPTLDLAFTDDIGFPAPQVGPEVGPEESRAPLQLSTRAYLLAPQPLPLDLTGAGDDAVYRVPAEQTDALLAALQQWPHTALRRDGQSVARMPRGDLAQLLRRMDRLQHPTRPPFTAAEEAEWMREYHYTLVRLGPPALSAPDAVHLECASQTHATSVDGAQLSETRILWITLCPEGAYLNMQDDGAQPYPFDLTDRAGAVRALTWAEFDRAANMLELSLSPGQRWDCGDRVRMGYTPDGTFAMIENRRYTRCRGVPARLWPVFWAPNSWRFAEPPPSNEGAAPPTSEGVEAG